MIIRERLPSTVRGGFKMRRQTSVRDLEVETPPPSAPLGAPPRAATPITGNKSSSF